MGDNEYIFIGDKIWSFDAKNKIVEYISPVGNNDVPYPYAVDDMGNIYLISFNVIIKNRNDVAKRMKEYDDPNDYYLEYDLITPDRGYVTPLLPKNNMGIDKWFVGDKQYTLRYEPFPEKRKEKEAMYIVDSKGKKELLTKNGYIDLIKKYGEMQSFEPLPIKKTYMDRDIQGTFLGLYMSAISQLS